MRKKQRIEYKVVGAYDTETCNIGQGPDARAYPVLFIFNDFSDIEIDSYVPGECDNVTFLRHEDEAIAYLEQVIGSAADYVPIICAYNLMFDLQPLLELLSARYGIRANAANSTNAYTVDLMLDDKCVLRFWDTFHLEQNGLAAMGKTCGLEKALGDWDYSLIRTPETPLSADELHYAARDVQVIPAYLKYLCDVNEWLTPRMLGCVVITKTSLVRQMARHEIGPLRVRKRSGKNSTLEREFETTAHIELPRDFDHYALRKACFRGGLTFTASSTASLPVQNVFSLDAVSMHHAHIAGKRLPYKFSDNKEALDVAVKEIVTTTRADVLRRYHSPFFHFVHACVRFRNLRLKRGSCFERWGIAICPRAKFDRAKSADIFEDDNLRNLDSELVIQALGYMDRASNPVFAFSKLYSADWADIHVSECELWCISQVYDFDSVQALYGEVSISTVIPPDYITLQTNILFERKSAAKAIDSTYTEGTPYERDIPASIPDDFARELKAGTMSAQLFHSWYQSTVKGMYNSIYGSQAMDVFKPDFVVDAVGELHIDASTRATRDNFKSKIPKRCRVLYTYGLRIVGYSRVHMILAMELIYEALGDRVRVTGGDTDSLKIACDPDVSAADLLRALEPLHVATDRAISHVQARVRRNFPLIASRLTSLGHFEIENEEAYPWHMEAWPKARASIDADNHLHVTLAGVSRPRGAFTLETWADTRLSEGVATREVLGVSVGYNTYIRHDTCHALEHRRPLTTDIFDADVTDYLGTTTHVRAHESIALYSTGRMIGDTEKRVNAENVSYIKEHHGRDVDISRKIVGKHEKEWRL